MPSRLKAKAVIGQASAVFCAAGMQMTFSTALESASQLSWQALKPPGQANLPVYAFLVGLVASEKLRPVAGFTHTLMPFTELWATGGTASES